MKHLAANLRKKNDTTKAAYPPLRAVLPDTDPLPQILLFFSLPLVCLQTAETLCLLLHVVPAKWVQVARQWMLNIYTKERWLHYWSIFNTTTQ